MFWRDHELSSISKVTYLYHNEVKEKCWGQTEIFEWLLECDVHIILCHMHQGVKNVPWDCSEYMLNLLKLDFHIGIPMAENVRCSMLNQNKIVYLFSLPERTNNTVAIALKNFRTHEAFDSHMNNLIYNGYKDQIF